MVVLYMYSYSWGYLNLKRLCLYTRNVFTVVVDKCKSNFMYNEINFN